MGLPTCFLVFNLNDICFYYTLNLIEHALMYRWRENEPGVFTGVIEGLLWQIRWSPDENDQLEFKVHGNKSFKPDREALTKKLVDYLRLDTPLESLYKQWAKSDKHFEEIVGNEKFRGVRILKQQPRENLFSFICSSNNNISRSVKIFVFVCSVIYFYLALLGFGCTYWIPAFLTHIFTLYLFMQLKYIESYFFSGSVAW